MKLTLHFKDKPPLVVNGVESMHVYTDDDHFELHEGNGLRVRIEEHNERIALDLAVFAGGNNCVRLKGGLR